MGSESQLCVWQGSDSREMSLLGALVPLKAANSPGQELFRSMLGRADLSYVWEEVLASMVAFCSDWAKDDGILESSLVRGTWELFDNG